MSEYCTYAGRDGEGSGGGKGGGEGSDSQCEEISFAAAQFYGSFLLI